MIERLAATSAGGVGSQRVGSGSKRVGSGRGRGRLTREPVTIWVTAFSAPAAVWGRRRGAQQQTGPEERPPRPEASAGECCTEAGWE